MTIREAFHAVDPYEGLHPEYYPDDLQGWNSNSPIFEDMVREVRPILIVEVGSWKGASAAAFATAVQGNQDYCEVVCVDTWLGAGEMWGDKSDPDRYQSLKLVHGYPTIYYTFLANMARRDLQGVVTPLPLPSLIAARLIEPIAKADLIYIDASHDTEDVYRDCQAWWKVLRDGGVMFGDDYVAWPSVAAGVNRWAEENEVQLEGRDGFWIARK